MMEDSEEKMEMEEGSEHEGKEYDKYEIESAANTLMKAEEIKADKELYKCCQDYMSKKTGHIQAAMGKKPGSLKELKQIAKDKQKAEMA